MLWGARYYYSYDMYPLCAQQITGRISADSDYGTAVLRGTTRATLEVPGITFKLKRFPGSLPQNLQDPVLALKDFSWCASRPWGMFHRGRHLLSFLYNQNLVKNSLNTQKGAPRPEHASSAVIAWRRGGYVARSSPQ